MDWEEFQNEIEEMRQELNLLVKKWEGDFLQQEVCATSQRLDHLLNDYYGTRQK